MLALRINIICLIVLSVNGANKSNVCNSFVAYFNMDSKNCWYNPDVGSDTESILKRHKYSVEKYEVTTEDDYILGVFRIANNTSNRIALLLPPAIADTIGWVDKGKNDSFGLILADAGYDVWLANTRGVYHSRKHKNYTRDDKEYWNFGFHEMGVYDMPAVINFIVNTTGIKTPNIFVIGYSLSGTVGMVYASMLPEHSKKWVQTMVLMAPTTQMNNNWATNGIFAPNMALIQNITKYLNITGAFQNKKFVANFLNICRRAPTMLLCLVIDSISFGNYADGDSPKFVPLKYHNNPDGTSIQMGVHYLQIAHSKKFQLYDYGKEENSLRYNSTVPPEYPLGKVLIPIILVYGEQDVITHKKDVEETYKKLPDAAKVYGKMYLTNMNHGQFFYGAQATNRVYKPLLSLFDSIHLANK